MKRKAFHMSGGKDRKAKKDKFVFTASEEEVASPETETESIGHSDSSPDTPAESATDVPNETDAEKSAEIQESIAIAPKEPPDPAEDIGTPPEAHSVPEPEFDQTEQIEKNQESSFVNQAVSHPDAPPELQEAPQLPEPEPEVECDPNAPLPTFYNGPNLAEIRKRCGVRLRAIWEETKIPIATLENIESENYEALPPEVYVRSFIMAYAKFLSLDPKKAVKDYMERYRVWRVEYEKQQKCKSSLFSFGKSGSFFGIKIKKS